MTVISIQVEDELNPVELNNWILDNPSATINFVVNDGRIFFIFYS